jgi:hypothetical protein
VTKILAGTLVPIFGNGFNAISETVSSGFIDTYLAGCVTLAGWMLLAAKLF